MLKLIKSFLKWISPITILTAEVPGETIDKIDKKFSYKEKRILDSEAQAILYSNLMTQIVTLTHQTVVNAYTAELSNQRPAFARMMLTDPNNPRYKEQINKWIKKWDFIKAEEADKLGAEILEVILRRFPSIAVANKINNKRLFHKDDK